jgi:hypothetical protein
MTILFCEDFDYYKMELPAMNDQYLTLDIFKTLLAYDPDVVQAIEDTQLVLSSLFPEQDVGVYEEVPL